ncbi:MAG: hypothetical protein ACI9KE_005670 [Polyangiales bacterium]
MLERRREGYCRVAVDIWILEVSDPSRAVNGLMSVFGLARAQSESLISSVPCRVKRDVPEQDAPRYEAKLKPIGATVTWGPAGDSLPPPARVKVPPNEAPDEIIAVPDVPGPFDTTKARMYWGMLGAGIFGVICLSVVAPGLSSGEAGWPTVVLAGATLGVLAMGLFGSVLSVFRLSMASPILPIVCGAIGAAMCVLVLRSSEPDPQVRLSYVTTLRAEVLGGQAPEARIFLSGNGTFETADAARSRAFVESLYESGARRVFVVDEDENGEAEWVAIDMPVLPARRNAIRDAVRAYAGENFNKIPPGLAAPSQARHWILPVDIH